MTGSVPLLRVRDLAIRHAGEDAFTPAAATFEVRRGEVVLLLGPSGSGKSTLTLALNGLIPHDIPADVTGMVRVGGLDTVETPVSVLSTRVGMVFQDPDAQQVTGTVLDEVAFGPENLRLPVAEVLGRSETALRRVGLWDRRHENPDALSGGGRQRLAIAAALALGSPVLVLDEPTANLDPQGIEEVYAALAEIVASGDRAIVLVEHNLDHAVGFVDRVVVLDAAGRTIAGGPVDDILRARAAELHALGVWLPTSALAALTLRRAGYALDPLPLTPAELRAALEACPPPAPRSLSETGAPAPRSLSETGAPAPRSLSERGTPAPRSLSERSETKRRDIAVAGPSSRSLRSLAQGPETSPLGPDTSPLGPDTHPAVSVGGLTLRRGRTEVLHEVDLDIRAGEFVAVIGANGAGKTSLLHAIAGVTRPPRGTVRIDGRDITRMKPREVTGRIGFVFQNPEHQFVAHTVHDELAYGLRHLPRADAEAQIADVLARFGLTDRADVHPFLLSGGQKRRLSVGTALVAGAPVLALDEPTFGQDRARADELLDLLARLNADGTTVIVVTHDMQLVTEYASRAVVLGDGRVLADGPTADVFADAALIARAGLRPPPLRLALAELAGHPELAAITRLADLPGPVEGAP
nr:ABC transporter ATP-binding protein [Microbacterium bovistercoris]